MICEIIVSLLVIVQNNNRCTVHGIKISLLGLYILSPISNILINLLDHLSEKIETPCLPETLLTTNTAALHKIPLDL